MVNYDSDSDSSPEDQYTETSVLLGYVSPSAPSDDISYIGGIPQWIDPSSPASASLARCKICRDIMPLLLQLNGELPEFPGHERRLYVFGCKRRTCQRREGCVRAIRGVRVQELSKGERERLERAAEKEKAVSGADKNTGSNAPSVVKSTGLGESLFGASMGGSGGSGNPFSSGSAGGSAIKAINPFSAPSSGTQSNPFANSSAFPSLSNLAAKPSQRPESETSPATDLPKTFATALSLNNTQSSSKPSHGPAPPPEAWPVDSTSLPKPYPTLYFDAVEREQLDDEEEDDKSIPPITMDIDEDTSNAGPQKEDKDTFESSIDNDFQKFADRLSQNPEQVIRYEFGGVPLLYTKLDAVGKLLSSSSTSHASSNKASSSKIITSHAGKSGMPACRNCGAARVFEVQMTPHAILELEAEEEVSLEGMEWGTIIVGVCERDCTDVRAAGEVAYLEEWVGVQWEEKMERGR